MVITLSLRKHRIDKSDIIDAISVRSGLVVQPSIVPVAFIRFRKNDQGMVDLADLFNASDFRDRIAPVTGSFGSMEDENERDRIRQIRGTNSR